MLAAAVLLPLAGCAGGNGGSALPTDPPPDPGAVAAVRQAAVPLTGAPGDLDALMAMVGDARVVLLGESTHGTHEFYAERARITRRLVEEKGFTEVAVEGEWPAAARVDRWIRGAGTDPNAAQALSGFTEFPLWMWRNAEVRELVEWMRAHNAALPAGAAPVRFRGLDVYSLFTSADEVVRYLERTDPAAAERARRRYSCFARFRGSPQAYGQAVEAGSAPSCQAQAAEQLAETMARTADAAGADDLFGAQRNASVVAGAEAYFRGLFEGVNTWNLRDRHMMATLEALLARPAADGRPTRAVVWAHNTHVGDARATHMGERGDLSLGQLARERHGEGAVLVGFTTYDGRVMAAREWGAPGEERDVRPALPGSFAALFHEAGIPAFFLPLRGRGADDPLAARRLERAIGVVYLPASERQSHYFHAVLREQFDAVVHLDRTRAVRPLVR
ncbi:MAG TPA: erythromycin esterase family protein [Longimicrobiaceae bacterium]|nr:erythromycin esterase family protein [Longimicrobiaceae bacterium]